VFDLAVLGGLARGVAVSIQSGPSAGGVFTWSPESIFRDDDPTDYARIVDDMGSVVHQVNCGGGVAPEPSPTASSEPSPVADVPNGGGAPPELDSVISPLFMLVVGGSMVAVGMATFALPALHSRLSPQVGHSRSPTFPAKGGPYQPRFRSNGHRLAREGFFNFGPGLALAGIAVTIAILLLNGGRRGRS
jgi:hypothetical protein